MTEHIHMRMPNGQQSSIRVRRIGDTIEVGCFRPPQPSQGFAVSLDIAQRLIEALQAEIGKAE